MSERAPITAEHLEALPAPEQHKALPTPEQAEPLRAGEADPLAKLEAARQTVEQQTTSTNPLENLKDVEQPSTAATAPVNKDLKVITLNRELKRLQKQLPLAQRGLSKVVHQPVVRAVSEAGARTVSRPSGLLGGGVLAFVGSSSYLYLARHIGFEYNYFVFTLLFVSGFIVGLLLEFAVWALTRRQQRNSDF